ncbi:MAG TPA: DUF3667 domain-containing protein [Pyrinomonadaceae bacterium]|nr:DUF3667 domain-containing protein [Pyrinomonadaceae bacterium]
MAEVLQTPVRAGAAAEARGAEVSEPLPDTAPDSCPSCGETLAGEYCHACGEKRPESRDLTVRRFFGEAAQELTSVEHSKLFNTLRALMLRPGFLTNEWAAGRRRLYLKPLNLCLGIFALSLFAYSVYKPVSMYDLEKFVRQDRREETMQLFDRFAAKKNIGRAELFERLSEKWQRYMSLAPLLFVGVFALVLQLVFLSARRYFVEHLVFSMHFVSFSTLAVVLLWPVYFVVGIKTGGVNSLIAVFKWVLDIAYMFFAVRAVYRLGNARTLLASVLLVVGYFACYLLVLGGALGLAILTVALS